MTIGLLAGQWPLQGPLLVGAGRHGVHAGDVVVLAASTFASILVLTATGTRR